MNSLQLKYYRKDVQERTLDEVWKKICLKRLVGKYDGMVMVSDIEDILTEIRRKSDLE